MYTIKYKAFISLGLWTGDSPELSNLYNKVNNSIKQCVTSGLLVLPFELVLLTLNRGSYYFWVSQARTRHWNLLLSNITHLLIHIAASYQSYDLSNSERCNGWQHCSKVHSPREMTAAEHAISRTVQKEMYTDEYDALESGTTFRSSPLLRLNTMLVDSLLRVGERMKHLQLDSNEIHPLILTKNHHVTMLLVRHYNEIVKHQGHHFTEGAIRAWALWLIGDKRLISSVINQCITCWKLDGKRNVEEQNVAQKSTSRSVKHRPSHSWAIIFHFHMQRMQDRNQIHSKLHVVDIFVVTILYLSWEVNTFFLEYGLQIYFVYSIQ